MTTVVNPPGVPAPAGLVHGAAGDAVLVHGMGKELVEPDWPPLTEAELDLVLAGYPQAGLPAAGPGHHTPWHSPRPMSAAALVPRAGGAVFVKRHHVRVRTVCQLAAEHAFLAHLRAQGTPVPAVLRTAEGTTVTRHGDFVYEVHAVAAGTDVYRDAVSWSPFTSPGHARAAGAALARLHSAAAGFPLPARPPGVLTSGCQLILAADPVAALRQLLGHRPGLAGYLSGRRWAEDLARDVLPLIRQAAPLLAPLTPRWGHGDWHPSNMTWTSAGPEAAVASVFDFGLANRTFPVHDLAIALERSTVGWLDLADNGHTWTDLPAAAALLDGYQAVRPLSPAEAAALPAVLPVAHVEYALSEVEYFDDVVHSPGNAGLAYDGYLLGHARWWAGPAGSAYLAWLRATLARTRAERRR